MHRFLLPCGILGVVLVLAVIAQLTPSPQAREAALVEKGQAYVFAWTCLPAPIGCYSEVLQVQETRKDGWVQVLDLHDQTIWFVNPGAAMAIQKYDPSKMPHPTGEDRQRHQAFR